jgi:hypothetical protein
MFATVRHDIRESNEICRCTPAEGAANCLLHDYPDEEQDWSEEQMSPEEEAGWLTYIERHEREERMSLATTRRYNRVKREGRRGHLHTKRELRLHDFSAQDDPPHPGCGQYALAVSSRYTPNYGGGFDTFERCLFCDYVGVYV